MNKLEVLKSLHINGLMAFVPAAFYPIFITLALSFLIGFEREEHSEKHVEIKPGERYYNFGGVRTFPIIGLCGYMLASLSQGQPLVIAIGALAIGALLWLSYREKLRLSSTAGMTSEASGLFTYLLGAVVYFGHIWEATALAVIVLLLLELKGGLEELARKIPSEEIVTFTRFLLISAVVLPIVPDHDFTDFHINPYHVWLIVVVISALSYAAYVVGKLRGSKQSVLLAALLGGLYSSTSATVVLAKRSREENASHLFSGAILAASGVMYIRLIVLLFIFNTALGLCLALPFGVLALVAIAGGWFWTRLDKQTRPALHARDFKGRNPLELQAALVFAALFTAMGVLTLFVRDHLGTGGIYGLSFFTGVTDIDPFVMSLTQSAGTVVSTSLAATGIVIAVASNNLIKGFYAAFLAGGRVRKQCLVLLTALSAATLLAAYFVKG